MELESCLQDAYQRGQIFGLMHIKKRCVLAGEDLVLLATDFAHLFLFRELHSVEVSNPHFRASLRMIAFQQGYKNNAVPEEPLSRKKRRRNHPRSKRSQKHSRVLV